MKGENEVLIIGGCGHVGLPFGMMLAKAGLNVKLHDLDAGRKAMVRAGKMPFLEHGAQPILEEVINKRLHVVDSLDEAGQAKWIVLTIGTPVDEYLAPKFSPLFAVADSLLPLLKSGQHIVVRSTLCPGATKALDRYFASRGSAVHVSYCPERIAQGYAIVELKRLPQLISGCSEAAVQGGLDLFNRLGCKTIVVSPEEAELAKLFLNSWRYIQFAIANQFYVMAEEAGIDFYRVADAMTYGYDRARDFPPPGFAAGPCLLKDTMQLSAFNKNSFLLGHAALLTNEGLPGFIVSQLRREGELSGKTVGILGMTFKANIDDIRDSLAYKVRKLLMFHGATVLCSDEFVKDPSFLPKDELVKRSEIVILGVPHDAYKNIVIPSAKRVMDVWGFFRRQGGQA